jgi:hypothetical protein
VIEWLTGKRAFVFFFACQLNILDLLKKQIGKRRLTDSFWSSEMLTIYARIH